MIFCIFIYIYICVCIYIAMCTSSTAQGGGGSFKDRKPIGEDGCCESRMAERNNAGSTNGWTVGLSICLSFCLPVICLSIHPNSARDPQLNIFDLKMCFAPQRVHFFNTDTEVVCENVLRATTVSTCSTAQLPKVLRH